jgi:hypothetical protein
MSAESEPLPATTPTAEQRIEKVLREHRWSDIEWACKCGERHMQLPQHPAHVAAAVVAALELTEESRTYEAQEVRIAGPWRTTPTEGAEK